MPASAATSAELFDSADVCIVGGGLLGTATAFFASSAGLDVVLLEERELASGASGAAFGGVSVSIYSYATPRVPPSYVAISRASIALYAALAEELGPPLDFVSPGSLDPFFDEAERPMRMERVDGLRQAGIDVELLSGDALRDVEPAIAPDVPGAAYCPIDGHVTPLNAVWAFADGALRGRARIRRGVFVHAVETRGGAAVGVQTSHGRVAADWVVLANGIGTRALARTADVDIPVEMSRGQMFVTERMPELVRTYLHTIKQTPSGTIVIGATREPEIDVPETTVDGAQEMLAEAVRLVPALRDARLLRSWAGIRPVPEDGYPILGPVDGIDGLLVAVMHRGVTLAPIVGQTLAELIAGRQPSVDIDDYRLSRFFETPTMATEGA